MNSIKLWCGDCLELMNDIEDKSIDCIICDLPYGTQKANGCKWDIIIPFDKLWEQYYRVLKPNGSVVLFAKEPFTSLVVCSNINEFKYRWNWIKDSKSNFMQANYQPLNNVEDICVFSMAYAREIEGKEKVVYNPQYIVGKKYNLPKDSKTTEIFSSNHKNGIYKHKQRDTSKRYPYITIEFNTVKGKEKMHPTQKPLDLLLYLVKTYSNENDTILDNTMGSGTCGVACKILNRNFIGIEKDEKYFNIAKERIEGCTR